MAMAHAHASHWQRISTAERIRAIRISDGDSGDDSPERYRERMAYEKAQGRMRDLIESPTGIRQVVSDGCAFLLNVSSDDSGVRRGAQELLRQGVVLAWGAFEIVARDSFVAYLNKHPSKSVQILQSERTQKRFGKKNLPLDLLNTYGFDLSNVMGDLLSTSQDLSDIATIRDVFNELFPGAVELHKSLAGKALYGLNKRRSLLVHRCGIVDPTYLRETGDTAEVGTEIAIDPPYLTATLAMIRDCGMLLLQTVSSSIETD